MKPANPPSRVYADILSSSPTDLDGRVLSALSTHIGRGNAISRRSLVQSVFGVHVDQGDDLSTLTLDRQIRDAIARLQQTTIILSSSREGGYYLPANWAEVTRFTAEIVSRAKKLQDKARRLEQLASQEFGNQMSLPL